MIRRFITEPNFTSSYFTARGGLSPAGLEIILTVHLAPMDPSKPYNMGRSDAPPLIGRLLRPELRDKLWPPKANLNFNTHLADTLQQVKHGFVFDGEQTRFKARSWMRNEFDEYKAKFKRAVEVCWNNQMILLPPENPVDGLGDDDYMDLVSNPKLPPHLVCSLAIFLVDNPTNANVVMQVVRLDREESEYAGKRIIAAPPGQGEFRSHAWLITNEDVYRRSTSSYRWPSISMSQIAVAHEIGHWLGRPTELGDTDRFVEHIDANKYPKTHPDYDELQYGGTPGHRASLLGGGSLATEYDARPWLNRARRHTRALFGWKYIHRLHFVGMVPMSARQKRLTGQAAPVQAAPTPQVHP